MTDEAHDFNPPWFPFWATKFTDSRTVRNMTPEEVGVYVLLLCDQWKEGSIPDDPDEWRGITNHADTNTVRAVLERCFYIVDERWVNRRLEEVREEQIEKRMQKVRAGRASGRARRRKSKSKRGNKKERRSNGVATENERSTNDKEEEVEEEDKPPIVPLWDIWVEEVWRGETTRSLTSKRRKKLEMVWNEHLDGMDDPLGFFRKMVRAMLADSWWGPKESTHVPEKAMRNAERREEWAVLARNGRRIRQDGAGRSLKGVK